MPARPGGKRKVPQSASLPHAFKEDEPRPGAHWGRESTDYAG